MLKLRWHSVLGPEYGLVFWRLNGKPSVMWGNPSRLTWIPYPLADLICTVVNAYYCRRYGCDWWPLWRCGKDADGQPYMGEYSHHFCTRCSREKYDPEAVQ